jgi:hypothetical protein
LPTRGANEIEYERPALAARTFGDDAAIVVGAEFYWPPGGAGRVDATFFGLAFLAALNPKLLGVDLLLMQSGRPRAMLACFLAGCLAVALAIGLLDVLVVHADAIKTQGSVSAGLDLALGVPLLAIGALVATGRLHGRRRASSPAPAAAGHPSRGQERAQRALRKPRFGLAVLIGALCGTPGGEYIAALHMAPLGFPCLFGRFGRSDGPRRRS